MGFPYGDGLYGIGLYSRRPDWWNDKACEKQTWDEKTCAPKAWAPTVPDAPAWAPQTQQRAIAPKAAVVWGRTR